MNKHILFKSIAYDSRQLVSNKKQFFSFFNENFSSQINEAIETEPIMVNWLASHGSFKSLLTGELKIPFDTKMYPNVKEPFISSYHNNPGDIDLLLIEPTNPKDSIAIECKKVNVTKYSKLDEYNKINKIKKSVKQTKGLLGMGFSQVYLAIIVGTYGANYTEANFLYRGIDDQTFHEVFNFPDKENLNDRVGIMYIEIVQTTGNSLNFSGMINLGIERLAIKQEQSNKITDKIKVLINKS